MIKSSCSTKSSIILTNKAHHRQTQSPRALKLVRLHGIPVQQLLPSRDALCRVFSGRQVSRHITRAQADPQQGSGLQPELKDAIDAFINEHKVVAFIKGTKEMPMCGFSNTVVQIFNTLECPYVTVNVLEDDLLRSGMKEYSQWPTFPQVYIDGDFYGGCDIMIQAYQNGELAETLEAALNS